MTRFGNHPRRGFSERRMPPDAGKVRAAWIAAPGLAERVAVEAASEIEAAGDFRRRLTNLSLTVRDLSADNFPLDTPSARVMAAAFLALARNFSNPTTPPEARTACAGFLREGAACVDNLLAARRSQEAIVGRRVLPREDD
jgi:hypothetical protein